MNGTTCLDDPADEALRAVALAEEDERTREDSCAAAPKSGVTGMVVGLRDWLAKRLPLDPPLE